MRPLRLELKGFTAFREPAVVDFTELDVFAISGPTGSGKSSLLDAMTYALYGRVERVGDRVGQLISQGQPRMAVTLEFQVGHDRYQLTRTTPAKGGTRIQLMRRDEDGEWQQAGEGSDRVRDVERRIVRTIGMTYDGFTRSVILPQGKFAEFLVGEAKKRRDILTELLGLSLFRRMAERAGAIGKEAGVRAQERSLTLEREYVDATPAALKAARRVASDAVEREQALARAGGAVLEILQRWTEAKRAAEELRSCADEAGNAAEQARSAVEELTALSAQLVEAGGGLERAKAATAAAQGAAETARTALLESDATLGSAAQLSAAQVPAHADREARRARARKEADRAAVLEASMALARTRVEAEQVAGQRRDALAVREADLVKFESGLDDARHADLVATVSTRLKVGDPCPVCGVPLEAPPKKVAPRALERATKAVTSARQAVDAAHRDLSEAERASHTADRDVIANAAERDRLTAEIQELDAAISGYQAALRSVFGDVIPEDAAAEVERRQAERARLDEAERTAARFASDLAQDLLIADRERDRLTSVIERHRDRLAADRGSLFERAARAAGIAAPARFPPPPASDDPEGLRAFGERLANALATFAARLSREVERRWDHERTLMDEASKHTAGLGLEPANTLEDLAETVGAATRAAAGDVATSAQRVDDLSAKLQRRKQLEAEVKDLEHRAVVFRRLAQELRADHLIAFLQAEALQLLAAAGSDRLSGLSDGRYRLVCREDEFLVVDTWNGDEERSVRTLSGGETFLASLALALALADQVRSLSVTDRARLDSLFLDEGFGTLDPDSLRTVTDAIEQLAGDGRLVGVITHVKELAEQFPRIEVEKQPSGSRLQLLP